MASQPTAEERHLLRSALGAAGRLAGAIGIGRLSGPILEKELRVSSRRRRNYVLRFLYLAVLTVFVALVWMEQVGDLRGGSASYRISRMPEIGKTITACIVGFQFFTSQVLAVVLLSTAVGEEIIRRTLGVLMSTPITSLQIVAGKLLGKMLQIILLLAISLPLLAVVRVFGGVPWEYVVAGLSVTLCWALFSGSVSLLLSVYSRRAYLVILGCFLIGCVLYGLLPWIGFEMLQHEIDDDDLASFFMNVNPFAAMFVLTGRLLEPRATAGIWFHWPVVCLVGLGASAGVLALATARVRKAALRQAGGGAPKASAAAAAWRPGGPPPLPAGGTAAWPARSGPPPLPGAPPLPPPPATPRERIRPVRGSPVLWRELRTPLFRSTTRRILVIAGAIALLLVTYGICAENRDLDDRDTHMVYGAVFVFLGILCTAVLSATTITTEKETQSWPILLLTPMSEWQILMGKAAGILRRTLPAWLLLFGHVLVFAFVGLIHPLALPLLAVLTAWVVVFLTCSGLYFSSRFKRTTTAVITNLALAVVLWVLVPFISVMVEEVIYRGYTDNSVTEWIGCGNPVAQAVVIMEGTSGERRAGEAWDELRWHWPDKYLGTVATVGRLASWAVAYVLAGCALAVLARSRLRRGLF